MTTVLGSICFGFFCAVPILTMTVRAEYYVPLFYRHINITIRAIYHQESQSQSINLLFELQYCPL